MKALIAGGGRLGVQIAQVLTGTHNEVVLIELDEIRAEELAERFPHGVVTGDACRPATLEEAGAHTADLAVAVTGADEDNLVIALLLKRRFAVPRVVARVNEPENAWLFDERWGVDVAVPSAAPLVSLIEEATSAADTVALLRLSKAGVEVVETVISARSRAAGRPIAEIALPVGTVVAAVVREGRPVVPQRDFRLQTGDELLLVSQDPDERRIRAAFQ